MSIRFLWFSVCWRIQGGKANNSELNTEYQAADFKHTALGASQGTQEDTHLGVDVCERSLGRRRNGRQDRYAGTHFQSYKVLSMQIILIILNGFEYQPTLSIFALKEIPSWLYNQNVM